MSIDDEIKRKQDVIRQQMIEAERKKKLEEAWRNFRTNSPFSEYSPILENTPLELQAVFYELMPKFKYTNPKFVREAPDHSNRVVIPSNNGSSNKRSFDIVLSSTGSGKDLKSLGIWFFSIDKIAFVRNNTSKVSWEEIKKEGITPAMVRDKVIEAIAMQNMKKSGGCYIATSVYGSYDCPEVWILRRYRDFFLMKSKFGRMFVKAYYIVSPILVKKYSNENWFKRFWTYILNKKIKQLKKKGYSDEQYYD